MAPHAIQNLIQKIDSLKFEDDPRAFISRREIKGDIQITANTPGLLVLARSFLETALSDPGDEYSVPVPRPITSILQQESTGHPEDMRIASLGHAHTIILPCEDESQSPPPMRDWETNQAQALRFLLAIPLVLALVIIGWMYLLGTLPR